MLIAGLVAVMTMNSCVEDTEPQYQTPTKFDLNTPGLAEQYYELTEDGTLDLTWSQPDYGYAAAASYKVQVSLEDNFVDSAKYVELGTEYKVCAAQVKESEIAEAICVLRGITSEEEYTDEPARNVYFKVRAYIRGIEGSDIVSNSVCLKQVKEYCAIQSPGYIYLVGAHEGWVGPTEGNASHYADWRLFESSTAIGSKIYSGVFNIPAGSAMFRFYTALTGWDADSYGAQVDDNPINYELTDGKFNGSIVKGKGSFNFPNWGGGTMKITVNLNNNSVIIEEGGVDTNGKAFIYLVGAPEGWKGPEEANASHYESWKLYDMEDNGVYTGTFDIAAGAFQFRFYKALTGWDGGASYGSQAEDILVDIDMSSGSYNGVAVDGKGNWNEPNWGGGKVAITVDTNSNQVTFTQK